MTHKTTHMVMTNVIQMLFVIRADKNLALNRIRVTDPGPPVTSESKNPDVGEASFASDCTVLLRDAPLPVPGKDMELAREGQRLAARGRALTTAVGP
jgi:hypothetical protein